MRVLPLSPLGKREHYAYDRPGGLANMTADSVAEFVQGFLSGALSPVPEATEVDAHGRTAELPQTLEELFDTAGRMGVLV